MTSRLAAGISARALMGENGSGENSGWEGRIGLGFPLVEMLSIGIAGRYSNFKVSDPHARPERVPVQNEPVEGQPVEQEPPDRTFKLKAFTLDAAFTLRPVEGLAIAGLAYNLIDTESPLAPMMVGGGVAFTSSGLTLGGDMLVDLNRHGLFEDPKLFFGVGVEYLARGLAPLRIGYAYDQGREQNFVTGGVGFVNPRFGAQFSLRQSVSGDRETSLFFGVEYFVQ